MKIDFSMNNHSKLLPIFGFIKSTYWNERQIMCLKKKWIFMMFFHIKTKNKLHCHIFDKLDLIKLERTS